MWFFPSSRAGFAASVPAPWRNRHSTIVGMMTQPPFVCYRCPLSGRALCRTASVCRLRHARCILSRDTMTDRTQPGVSHAFRLAFIKLPPPPLLPRWRHNRQIPEAAGHSLESGFIRILGNASEKGYCEHIGKKCKVDRCRGRDASIKRGGWDDVYTGWFALNSVAWYLKTIEWKLYASKKYIYIYNPP